MYVNSLFSGARTSTDNFTAYINPYLVVSKGGNYTKHIYIGSQRIVSKLGDLDSYGQDPRRIAYAGSEVDGASINFAEKYKQLQQTIKDRYADFEVPYNGTDNADYVNGGGFCCDDSPQLRAGTNDNPELYQYYYHSDHLGSTSLITNLDGEIVQHVEYVPFGEVFIEERNNTWNTPYLFNAKELDEETGLYYYDTRYFDPRISVWLNTDPMQEKYPNVSTYAYCKNNPVNRIDPTGMDDYMLSEDGCISLALTTGDEFDQLYFPHNTDNNFLKISDKKLLPQLTTQYGDEGKNAITSNGKDAFNVFKFAADNSNVEWSLSGFKDEGKVKFYINTLYSKNAAETGESNGIFAAKNMLFNVHSHPGEDGTKGGSGYDYQINMKTNKVYLAGYDAWGGSDGIPAKRLYEKTGKVMPLYVYHPYSKGLYKYTPWDDTDKTWLNIRSTGKLKNIIYP